MTTKIAFTIDPYAGADELRFGTTLAEVCLILGKPLRYSENRAAEPRLVYETVELTFSSASAGLVEISFCSNVSVFVGGVNIFNDFDALQKLMHLDYPAEYVGILLFPKLGISATGLHNGDEKNRHSDFTWQIRCDQTQVSAVISHCIHRPVFRKPSARDVSEVERFDRFLTAWTIN